MSIFGSIVSAIFGQKAAAAPAGGSGTSAPASTGATPPPSSTSSATAGAISRADVETQISKIAQSRGSKYNWQTSIVDLMKLLDLDSSLTARKQLAQELGYSGALDGSAEMNIWLHQKVMEKLAESGGRVPDSLRH
jgi:hypothetical protein